MSTAQRSAAVLAVAMGVSVLVPVSRSAATPPIARDPTVITEWNAIAARTIFTENATPIPTSGLYFGFVSLAVYDAVVAIEGRYEPVMPQPRPQAHASPEVAAATAAYLVLDHFFPASHAALATDYEAALADVADGVGKVHGVRVGRAAATTVIEARVDDGRGAEVPQPGGTETGQWRTTPDAFLPMLAPWLGFVDPLLVDSATGWLPGPDTLDSEAYATDFLEVKQYGARDNSLRSPEQTATAHFWNTNSVLKYQLALADRLAGTGFDIADAARAFAILNAGTGDSLIACWRGKYDFEYWRPVTAIRLGDTDGNDGTEGDPAWTSLFAAPPYPDYPSGHACITGAFSETASHLFGADDIDVTVPSLATPPARFFATADELDRQTENGRIWLGIHFRKAMTDGTRLGHDVVDAVITEHFQPVV